MARGKVKWFSPTIGAGFIRTDEGQDVFFSVSAIRDDDPKIIERGQCVSFDILKKQNGISLSAANVKASDLT